MIENLQVGQVSTLLSILNKCSPTPDLCSDAVHQILRCDLKELGREPSLTLYEFVRAHKLQATLSGAEKEILYQTAARCLSGWEVERRSERQFTAYESALKLAWARMHWSKEPGVAYSIFASQDAAQISEALLLNCTRALLERKHQRISGQNADETPIRPEHIAAVLPHLPFDNLELRVFVAGMINHHLTYVEVSDVYAARGDLEQAYRLRVASEQPFDERFIERVVEPLIAAKIAEAQQKNWFWYATSWVDKRDEVAYALLFERLVPPTASPRRAFEFALERKDTERMNRARDALFAHPENKSVALLSYFIDQKDSIGIEQAKGIICTEYKIGPQEVDALLALQNK